MIVDSGTRWLPEALKPSAQSRGECASLGTNAGHQLQSFGRRRNGVLAPIKSRVVRHIKLLRNCDLKLAQENFTGASVVPKGGYVAPPLATKRESVRRVRVQFAISDALL